MKYALLCLLLLVGCYHAPTITEAQMNRVAEACPEHRQCTLPCDKPSGICVVPTTPPDPYEIQACANFGGFEGDTNGLINPVQYRVYCKNATLRLGFVKDEWLPAVVTGPLEFTSGAALTFSSPKPAKSGTAVHFLHCPPASQLVVPCVEIHPGEPAPTP